MIYSRRKAILPRFISIKVLFTACTLIVSQFYCSSQVWESTNSHRSSFVFGTSLHHVLSSNNESRRYALNEIEGGDYTDISNEHRSSKLLQFTGEFQFIYWYVRGGFGMRTEHTSIEAHHTQDYYDFSSGPTYDSKIDRSLFINEKTASLMLSIEAGSYFFKRDRPIRVGVGAGFDFCAYLKSKPTDLNQINKEERVYFNSFPQYDEITESKHLKGSEEWALMVRDVSMPLIVPKISFKASYRVNENFSVSLQARVRLLILQPEVRKAKTLFEFPVGVGFHYHFLE